MATPVYRLYHRNGVYDRVDEITDWISLKCITRFNDVGAWSLELLRASPSASIITRQSGIILTRDILDGSGELTIFSGRLTRLSITAQTLRLEGYDDMALLRAPALPTTGGPPYTDEYAVQGPTTASTVMNQLVHTNIGPGARTDRRVTGLTVATDPVLGTSVISRTRFDSLIDELTRLAVAGGGLRFNLQQADPGHASPNTLVFSVAEAQDRTADAKFSIELGTALDFEDVWEAPPYNYLYVLGGEEMGADRPVTEGGDSTSITEVGLQIEAVLDARGAPNDAELTQKLTEGLDGAKPSRRVTLRPFENPSIVYGVSYDMGDLVQFVIDGTAYPAVVREVMIEWKPDDGIRITPTIGDPGSSNDPAIVQHYQTLATRVSYLEANWNLPPITTAAIGDIGTLRLTAAAAASTGWLLCQGQTVSRTTYAALFAVLGTTFNTGGEAGTVFRLPDMRGRFAMGASATYTLGQYGGAATYDMTHSHAHDHGGTTGNSTNINADMGAGSGQRNAANHEHPIASDSTVGGSATQSVLNPYLALNYEIFSGVV